MFKHDYEKSRQKEQEFENYIKSRYKLQTENSSLLGDYPNWDVSTTANTKHNNKVTTFEVKYNADYGNNKVVIENCKIVDEIRIPCGLSLTSADWYVLSFENDSNWYIIPTLKLKELVDDVKSEKFIVYDQNNYQLHIFDKPWLLSFCKII